MYEKFYVNGTVVKFYLGFVILYENVCIIILSETVCMKLRDFLAQELFFSFIFEILNWVIYLIVVTGQAYVIL